MFKKLMVGIFLVGLIAVLIVGAINRTTSKDRHSREVPGGSETFAAEDGTSAGPQSGEGSGANGAGQTFDSGSGTGQAVQHEWVELEGEVESVDETGLTIALPDGQRDILDAREWKYAQEHGFWVQIGDQLLLSGFYQSGDFKPGRIEDLTSGLVILVRDMDGRPMWAGGKKGGN